MEWRRISEAEVEAVLRDPDRVEVARKGRKNASKAIPERRLRVTYQEESRRIVVVTVVDKRD